MGLTTSTLEGRLEPFIVETIGAHQIPSGSRSNVGTVERQPGTENDAYVAGMPIAKSSRNTEQVTPNNLKRPSAHVNSEQ